MWKQGAVQIAVGTKKADRVDAAAQELVAARVLRAGNAGFARCGVPVNDWATLVRKLGGVEKKAQADHAACAADGNENCTGCERGVVDSYLESRKTPKEEAKRKKRWF